MGRTSFAQLTPGQLDAIEYDGFPGGMDNLHDNADLPEGVARNAVNFDVLKSGHMRPRGGIAQAQADAGSHSVFSDGLRVVWATASALKITGPNFDAPTTLLTDSRLAKPLSWIALNGELYFSNEDVNGKINADDAYEPWGIEPPTAAPILTRIDTVVPVGGELRTVLVTCAFVIGGGEESGAPEPVAVQCGDTPIISASNIPQSTDSRVTHTRLYVTTLDGTQFYAEVDVPAGRTSTTLAGFFGTGQKMDEYLIGMQPPPPGQLIDYTMGRIFIASGNIVVATRPLRYGLYDPEEDYRVEPERITMLKSVKDGFFLSSDQTYFYPAAWSANEKRDPLFPYRAIEGAAIDLPDSSDVVWLSERGIIRGQDGGAAKNLTEDRIAMSRYARATLGIVERDGAKLVVVITTGGATSPLVNKDFTEAENTRLAEVE